MDQEKPKQEAKCTDENFKSETSWILELLWYSRKLQGFKV
jgi:hypothetical protein